MSKISNTTVCTLLSASLAENFFEKPSFPFIRDKYFRFAKQATQLLREQYCGGCKDYFA